MDNNKGEALKSSPLQVLLVDDHPIILAGLVALFEGDAEFELCGSSDSLTAALDAIGRSTPDVVISGLDIEEGDGLKLLSTLGETPLMVITSCQEPRVAQNVLEKGAKGYILTREHCENILMATKQVARGEIYVCGGMVAKILDRLVEGSAESPDSIQSMLSKRELQVFELVGQGFNTRQVADQLHLSRKTIDTYRQHIRTKLGLAENCEIAPKAVAWLHDLRN